jgi:MoxR-like ATPase
MARTKSSQPQIDLTRIAAIGATLRKMTKELAEIFPERGDLIQQILYALLTREHVLVFGTYGTGKSDLLRTLFDRISGSTLFSIGMSKFMTEGSLIGAPDPRRMRDTGELWYRREGGILDCHFAELDELFDSNAPLLRVLLGILHERQLKRGRQTEIAKLHTAIACTNGEPDQEVKRAPELGAVIDRFLFQCRVGYLTKGESRRQMYEKYLSGRTLDVELKLEDLVYLSSVVVDANQITDPQFIAVYDELIEACQERLGIIISDRRKCKLLQLAEANALLFGRYEVTYEDLLAIRWGLCRGGDSAQQSTFDAVAGPIIEKAQKSVQQSIDVVQIQLLNELAGRMPTVPDQADPTQLVETSRSLHVLHREIEAVRPQLPSTEDKKRKLLERVDNRIAKVNRKIAGN